MVALVQNCTGTAGQYCEVQLDPQQLQLLSEHMQANAVYEATFLCFILLCVSAMAFMMAMTGRG